MCSIYEKFYLFYKWSQKPFIAKKFDLKQINMYNIMYMYSKR